MIFNIRYYSPNTKIIITGLKNKFMEFLNHFRNGLVEGEDRDCFEKFLSPHVSMLYKSGASAVRIFTLGNQQIHRWWGL